jgi:hypothetical protein
MSKSIASCLVVLLALALPAQAQTAGSRAAAGTSSHAAKAAPPGPAANQFSSDQAAKGHCPGDAIVWVNLSGSKAYHPSGDRYYGKTKHGAFMCQKEADQSGFHAASARAGKTATKNTNPKATTK